MKKKILVVDDEDFQRDLLNKLLSKSGYEVAEAESPEVALAIMKNEDFPVIITDLIMLDMDGVEFCQRIRERNSQSVIIALTGYADLYDLEKDPHELTNLFGKPEAAETQTRLVERIMNFNPALRTTLQFAMKQFE